MRLIERTRELHAVTGGSTNCGWMCDDVAFYLHSLVRLYKPELVIQTGHLWGKSALAILEAFGPKEPWEPKQNADAAFAAFLDTHTPQARKQKLISIDPLPMGVPHSGKGIDLLQKWYPGQFEFVKCRSDEFFARYVHEGGRIFGIVDGNHSDAGCREDIRAMMLDGAEVIVVDDTDWLPSLNGVAEACADNFGYSMMAIPHYNGLAVLTRQ